MKLADWLKRNSVSRAEFARRIGVSPGAVTLICRDDGAWLSRETAERIVAETGGAVTPNDFLLDPPPARKGHDMHHPVTEAIEAFARGEIVVVTDDDDRENEGDMIVAASLCTTEKMAFIIRNGCGIVCAPLTADDARRLHLPPMVAANDAPLGTAFTVSVDVKHGLTTGISAEQRCNTVRALANGNMGASDFVRPGHVFPLIAKEGGVLMRSGHTEAAVDLCRLARPAAGRGHLRTRQRRRHRHGRAADRGLRRQAQAQAHFGRRPHRLPAGAREAGRARRDLSGQDADRRAAGLRLPHAVRHRHCISPSSTGRSATAATCRRGCIAADILNDIFGGGPIPKVAAALQGGGARRARLPARRLGGRAGEFRRRRQPPGRTARAPSNGARSASARRSCATSA